MTPGRRPLAAALVVAAATAVPPDLRAASTDDGDRERLERLVTRWRALAAADPLALGALAALVDRQSAASPDPPSVPADAAAAAVAPAWPAPDATVLGGDPSTLGVRWRLGEAAVVRAPAPGRVVFADRVDGLGLVLITAHGDEYHSVLAGMAALDVEAGVQLHAGEPIGRMAEGDENTLELQLELRHHGRPVDPLPWLGVVSAGDGPS